MLALRKCVQLTLRKILSKRLRLRIQESKFLSRDIVRMSRDVRFFILDPFKMAYRELISLYPCQREIEVELVPIQR